MSPQFDELFSGSIGKYFLTKYLLLAATHQQPDVMSPENPGLDEVVGVLLGVVGFLQPGLVTSDLWKNST